MKKILVIDDQKESLIAIKDILTEQISECEVFTAQSGPEGIKIAKKELPDTILLDIQMPEMDGFEVCKRLKANEITKNIPIIIETGIYTDSETHIKALNLGADAFLTKPLDASRLIAQVNVMIRIKRSNKELQWQKNYFESLFNSAPAAIVSLDMNQNILDINPQFESLFGYSLNEIRGKNIDRYVVPQDKLSEAKKIAEKVLLGETAKTESIRKRKDGSLVPVTIGIAPILVGGKQVGLYGIYRDITERKRAEQIQSVLYNIADAVHTTKDLNELFKFIRKYLNEVLDTTNCYVALYDKETDTISLPFQVDEKDKFNSFPVGKTFTSYVIRTSRPLLATEEVQKEMIQAGEVEAIGTPSKVWLGVPLKLEGEVIGVVAVQSYTDPLLYTEKDVEILEFVSGQVAIAIERKKVEKALQIEKAYLEQLFESSPEAIILTDNNSILLKVNNEFTRMFEYTSDEAIGQSIDNIIAPGDIHKEAKSLTKDVSSGKGVAIESVRRRKDGTLVNVSILGTPIKVEGGQVAVYGIYRDITERKQAEEERERLITELTEAKGIIEEKNENIMSSIRYAKRIQQAILPVDEIIHKILLEHFVIFKPREIVSGDFYWFSKTEELIAVVDCTGHGVPGAFMSMIGNSLLNKIVNEDKIFDPAIILENLHDGVRFSLKQESEETDTHDGMDACLCLYDPISRKVTFAGAKRPLYYINNSKLIEIKGDRKPVGGKQKEEKRIFTNKEIDIQPGDIIYLTTDGLADQNNSKGIKYGSRRLKEFLLEHSKLSLSEQKEALLIDLNKFQGDEPQRDDILIIGIRFKKFNDKT
ncbi:MAG: PAS domain S-box protein [Candidatus Cloacimonetes bacterium]|nr:PAS domain S-box protein [Candidatus Cloacimonadota bacterium]